MKIAVVGATGLVGSEVLDVLEGSNLPISKLFPVASEKSIGKEIRFKGEDYKVISISDAISEKPEVAIFSAGSETSLEFAPKFEKAGSIVIDNSSAWRMSPVHKLIVPEINGHILRIQDRIIANPNCSTIQLLMVLAPLHVKYKMKRVVVSTYQSVTGTGKAAVEQLMNEREGNQNGKVYPHEIDMNALPHIDVFMDNGYTKEEMKIVNETQKILDDNNIAVTATAVRLPVMGGHSESVNIEFIKPFDMEGVLSELEKMPGVVIQDNPSENIYPMPLLAQGKDDVYVGRIRKDNSNPQAINLWIVADNLRKGAATNAVQIAEYMWSNNLIF